MRALISRTYSSAEYRSNEAAGREILEGDSLIGEILEVHRQFDIKKIGSLHTCSTTNAVDGTRTKPAAAMTCDFGLCLVPDFPSPSDLLATGRKAGDSGVIK